MNYSLLAKVAIAGAVLTGVTGTAAMGNIVGVNQEAKAQIAQPNAHLFKQNVEGKVIDFTDTFTKKKLNANELSNEIKSKLEAEGIDYSKFKFKLEVKTQKGETISGGGDVGGVPSNQQATFDPNTDELIDFSIYLA